MEAYLRKIKLDLSDALQAAPSLLGYKLTYETDEGTTSGIIVETEAYKSDDPASHAFIGHNKRNNSLFEPAGTIYVYFTYGLHYCLNIVTGPRGNGQAVLIRAIEPIDGTELMTIRRKIAVGRKLTSGPAKLTQAMGINGSIDGTNILNGSLRIEPGIIPKEIITTERIGISKAKDYPWRFYIKENQFVSRLR